MRKTVKLIGPDGQVKHYDASGRDVHIDQPLSELLLNYRPASVVVDDIFVTVDVPKQHDAFYEFRQGDLWRIPSTERSPLTAPKFVDLNVSSHTYFAKNFSLRTGISIEDGANADAVLSLRENKSLFLANLLGLDRERRAVQLMQNSANVGSVTTVASGAWTNWETSGPLVDIFKASEAVRLATGYKPNRMVVSADAWANLRFNETLRKLIFPAPGGGAGPGIIAESQVAAVFGFDQVRVGGAFENLGKEGLADDFKPLWGPHAFVYYSPQSPSRETPSWAYRFRWSPPGMPAMQVEQWFNQDVKGTFLDVGEYYDIKITGRPFAVWVSSVL